MTLSRPLKIAMGIFAFVMLGLLATQIVLLTDQLRTVRTQRSIAERQAARTLPLLDAVRPLVADTRSSLPELRRGASRLGRLVRGATPLVSDLRSARAPEAVRATLALASTLLGARVGATTESVRALAIQLNEAQVGPAVAGSRPSCSATIGCEGCSKAPSRRSRPQSAGGWLPTSTPPPRPHPVWRA